MSDESTGGNLATVLSSLRDIGYMVACVKVDPLKLVGCQSRRRILFYGIHINRYMFERGLGHVPDKEEYVFDITEKWAAKVYEIMENPPDILHFHQFLLDEDHPLVKEMQSKWSELAFGNATVSKRGRKTEDWKRAHTAAYLKDAHVTWTEPHTRNDNYSTNAAMMSVVPREQDIVLFWDLVQPMEPNENEGDLSNEAEICTSLF